MSIKFGIISFKSSDVHAKKKKTDDKKFKLESSL